MPAPKTITRVSPKSFLVETNDRLWPTAAGSRATSCQAEDDPKPSFARNEIPR